MGSHQGIIGGITSGIDALLQPGVLMSVLGNVLVIVLIVTLSLLVIKLLSETLKKLQIKHLPSMFIYHIQSVLKWIIFIVGFLLILQQFGIKINSLWAVLSTMMAMVAIGFVAVWSVLSNLLCTLLLIIFQPFRIGDHVEIIDPAMTEGVGGKVKNINLFFTSLDSSDDSNENLTTQVPNNLFFQKILRKKSGLKTHSLEKQVFEEASLLAPEREASTKKGG